MAFPYWKFHIENWNKYPDMQAHLGPRYKCEIKNHHPRFYYHGTNGDAWLDSGPEEPDWLDLRLLDYPGFSRTKFDQGAEGVNGSADSSKNELPSIKTLISRKRRPSSNLASTAAIQASDDDDSVAESIPATTTKDTVSLMLAGKSRKAMIKRARADRMRDLQARRRIQKAYRAHADRFHSRSRK